MVQPVAFLPANVRCKNTTEERNPTTGWTEYDAAYHLLTAPMIASRTRAFIHRRDFDWAAIFRVSEPWSRSERMFVQAASDLWSGGRELDGRRNIALYDPIHTLDGGTSRASSRQC